MDTFVVLENSERHPWPGSTIVSDVRRDERVLITAWFRGRTEPRLLVERATALGSTRLRHRSYESRASLREATDASDADVNLLARYCSNHHIDLVERHWRSATFHGTLGDCIDAFGASVSICDDGTGHHFRHRSGAMHLPSDVASIVHGIYGFEEWPRSHRLGALQHHATPLCARDVAARYRFPDATGKGQTLAILQLGGTFRSDDFDRCMHAQGLTPPIPHVKRIDNALLLHTIATTSELEAALDVQIAASLAPDARIVLYQAPDNERGVLDAIRHAIFDEEMNPWILSISYGWPEPLWTPAALDLMNDLFIAATLLGISVFCAAGDAGAELALDGKPHVVAPASVPFVHACGGTILDPQELEREGAWERTGGGFSESFALPQWQEPLRNLAAGFNAKAGRAVPDVAGQQSPGYLVYLEGEELAAGGTSAVAPMWAALTARLNERLGTNLGLFTPLLYTMQTSPLRDIVEGTNQTYRAQTGWDPCTGFGVPDGMALEAALREN